MANPDRIDPRKPMPKYNVGSENSKPKVKISDRQTVAYKEKNWNDSRFLNRNHRDKEEIKHFSSAKRRQLPTLHSLSSEFIPPK